MDTLLTTRQLQSLLQVDRITIYRMLQDGRLPGFKVGGQWRFPRQAVEQWLQEQQERKAALAAPGAASSPSPALPLSCVQAIQDIVAEALEVGAVTTAPDGSPLTRVSHDSPFCALILGTEEGRQRCMRSWHAAFSRPRPSARGREAEAPIERCHAGLGYVSERVEVQSELVAVVHAGQFLIQPPGEDKSWPERLADLARVTGVPAAKLREALADVPVLDREKQEQIARLLRRVAATFAEIGQERLSLLTRLQRIAEMTQL